MYQKWNIFLAFCCFLLIFAQLNPANSAPSLKNITEKIKIELNKIETMKANLETKMTSPLFNQGKPQTLKSIIYKKGSDKLRTETALPRAQINVINGNMIYAKDLETGQLVKTEKNPSGPSLSPNQDFINLNNYLNDYDMEIIELPNKNFQLKGIPKVKNELIKKILITFNGDTYQATRIVLLSHQETEIFEVSLKYQMINEVSVPVFTSVNIDLGMMSMSMEMTYSNVEINIPLSDDLFVLN